MQKIKQIAKNYLLFSKRERIAMIIFLTLSALVALLPFFPYTTHKTNITKDDFKILLTGATGNFQNQLTHEEAFQNTTETYYQANRNAGSYAREPKGHLFNFDPNTASADDFKNLGFRDKTISILCNYRNKGGKFRKADDLQKIYGLQPSEFERLKPFIVIAGSHNQPYSNNYQNQYVQEPKHEYKKKAVAIDINTADTTAFQSLYGIGNKLAARIVNFRNKLGGFYTTEQVGETYGVPDSTFQKIKPYLQLNAEGINKLNINTATYDELNAHPYISSKLAFLMMKYRKENGNFKTVTDIKDLVAQTNDSYEKVINYLKVD